MHEYKLYGQVLKNNITPPFDDKIQLQWPKCMHVLYGQVLKNNSTPLFDDKMRLQWSKYVNIYCMDTC